MPDLNGRCGFLELWLHLAAMRIALNLERRGDVSWRSLVFYPNEAARCGNILFCISPLLNYLYLPAAQNNVRGNRAPAQFCLWAGVRHNRSGLILLCSCLLST
jgi:hypothetical protein